MKKNKDKLKEIETWINSLGYNFNNRIYRQLKKISYSKPSYKIMANMVLESLKLSNPILDSASAWRYTTKFVNGMKSNLILNNKYFQGVLENGLFEPHNNKQNKNINLIGFEEKHMNRFNYIKNIKIGSRLDERTFDFVITVNRFPLILLEIIDSKYSSFNEAFNNIELAFEKYPMFFNFNKFILLTDGTLFKLGTIYDFPDEYISFQSVDNKLERGSKYDIKILEKILSKENILDYLKMNKNIKVIVNNAEKNLENKKIREGKREGDLKKAKEFEEDEELSFLADFFEPDLNKTLSSDEFKRRLRKTREVPDYKENKSYIEDILVNKNMDTLDVFIEANERLVLKEASKFINYETSSMDFDDMYQLGYIGMLEALKRFDLDKGYEFSTYAVYWIRQVIIRGINDDSLLVRIPVHNWENILKLKKLEYRSDSLFNKIDYDWIGREMNMSKEKILELVKIRNTFMLNISLDTPVGVNEDSTIGEFIIDKKYDIEEIILNQDLKHNLEEVLNMLDPRSKDILVKRFGLNGKDPMTLEEIGQNYSLTRERIRQIESKALKKLRKISKDKELKDYCEG